MKLSDKITLLKSKLNHNYSSWAQTLDSTSKGTSILSNDYANAVIFALRFLGKELAIWKKSILIPLEYNKRYYATYINLYTKDLIDICKPTQLAFVGFNPDTSEWVVGELSDTTYEAIERNQYIDSLYFGQKLYGDHFSLKSSAYYTDNTVTGVLNSVSANPSSEYVLPCTNSVTSGSVIFNLEFAEKLYNWYATASTTGTSPTVDTTVKASGWLKDDKLWVANGMQSFMLLTFTAIPQLSYLSTLTTSNLEVEIPILPQFQDDIDDICLNYLYDILIQRDPDRAKTYLSTVKLGLRLTNDQVKRKVMARASTMESAIVERYNPGEQRYGR